MFVVEASETVQCSADDVLAFVLDLDRYRQADHKIRSVRSTRQDGDDLVVSMWTKAGLLPTPVTQRLHLTPGRRIDVTNEPSWQDRLLDFHGEFECEPAPRGVKVTHRYSFDFKGPGRLIEPLIRRWLQSDIRREVSRLRTILEEQTPRS